jgi:hypothetical protein
MDIEKLKGIIENNKSGFTIDGNGNAYTGTGFAVSITDFIPENDSDLKRILKEYNAYTKKGIKIYLGGWINNNKLYLDITLIIKNLKEAIRTGRALKQKTIYNFGTKKVIDLNA